MKTLSLTLIVLCITTFSFAQNISIADFIKLRASDRKSVTEKLAKQSIFLFDQDEMYNGSTLFTFHNEEKTKHTALQWVDYVAANGDATWNNRLSFQIQDIEKVKEYIQEMKNLGFHFMSKKVIDRQVYEVYTDGKSTIELITSQSRKVYDNNMYFNFAFYSNSEYEYAFANENKKYDITSVDNNNLYAAFASDIQK
ncbi:MAG TPA: hypothetical protein PKM51_04335 [Chitinophagales bacterium]|nr:hypothetical protein [Chitinophagales bacterium]